MNDEHILEILATTSGSSLTIGDLARRLGISPTVVLPAARRLVDDGLASPSLVAMHDVFTVRGLLPRPTAKDAW